MRSVRAKKLLREARKRGRNGAVVIGTEYERLKKEHNNHSQNPKHKLSRRQQRRKEFVTTKAVKDAISEEVRKRTGIKANNQPQETFAPKSKAHRWPRVRMRTQFGYRTYKP